MTYSDKLPKELKEALDVSRDEEEGIALDEDTINFLLEVGVLDEEALNEYIAGGRFGRNVQQRKLKAGARMGPGAKVGAKALAHAKRTGAGSTLGQGVDARGSGD